MRRNVIYIVLALMFFAVGYFISRIKFNPTEEYHRTRILMGTVVEIKVRNENEEKSIKAIEEAFKEIKRIDDLFSTYNPDSPISKINNTRDTLITVDPEIYELMVICDSIRQLTAGAFDVSLNNLLTTWGFDGDDPKVPEKVEIKTALIKSGWGNISLMRNNKFNLSSNVGLNFGAITKGYAVERAIKILKRNSITNALVNAGGEIKTIDNDWIIGIQHPRIPNQIIEKIKPNKFSVATSGDYEKYFEIEGKRYHHILNPETGYPADSLISVTILHKDCTMADALATAVFVLGPVKGLNFVEGSPDTEVMMINTEGTVKYSNGFNKFILKDQEN